MNKNWLHIALYILFSTTFWGCQKATLIEDEIQEIDLGGRHSEGGGKPTASAIVTPEFDVNGW